MSEKSVLDECLDWDHNTFTSEKKFIQARAELAALRASLDSAEQDIHKAAIKIETQYVDLGLAAAKIEALEQAVNEARGLIEEHRDYHGRYCSCGWCFTVRAWLAAYPAPKSEQVTA